jgi:hypothetical protein
LLEQAGAPFGAAEYIGDFSTNPHGDGHNTFTLIVQYEPRGGILAPPTAFRQARRTVVASAALAE